MTESEVGNAWPKRNRKWGVSFQRLSKGVFQLGFAVSQPCEVHVFIGFWWFSAGLGWFYQSVTTTADDKRNQ